MNDRFGRRIDCLRVSVTDRCNLRCEYCMPETGVALMSPADVLSFEEICQVVTDAVSLGITRIKLTGGEPLVRRNLVGLVEMLARIDGLTDLSMTTNGMFLEEYAVALKRAGLRRVNVSLDTLDPERYAAITRGGNIHHVLAGLETAARVGLMPIKLNCVVETSSAEPDACGVSQFAREHGYAVQFIRRMQLAQGIFHVVEGGHGGDCPRCNRLRLGSTGYLRPCLFNDAQYGVRELGSLHALQQAIAMKPESGVAGHAPALSAIGG